MASGWYTTPDSEPHKWPDLGKGAPGIRRQQGCGIRGRGLLKIGNGRGCMKMDHALLFWLHVTFVLSN
eukprot:scaffold105134_cov38-Prasinocladus_malaysianus.AAC.1